MNQSCEGCQLLDQGIGGENQLAHMYPGGCLWSESEEEDSFNFSSTLEENGIKEEINNIAEKEKLKFVDNPYFYIIPECLICKDTIESGKEADSELSTKCESCSTSEGIDRFIKYQNFMCDSYKNV